jgi:hypothetical protein
VSFVADFQLPPKPLTHRAQTKQAKEIWDKNKPMNDEELLFQQVQMTTSASPGTTVWVYRCSV